MKHAPDPAEPPRDARSVGRSRPYSRADLSPRLRHWHAPRVNRWEKLCVEVGTLTVEYLHASTTCRLDLASGDERWFGPGTRWRVADMDALARFTLEILADSRGQARNPQPLRTQVLDTTGHSELADMAAFETFLAELPLDSRHLVTVHAPMPDWVGLAHGPGHLFWHPLERRPGRFTALLARSRAAFDLAGYLGRDHAVIEAALGQALNGQARAAIWMRTSLARHLRIEEELLFPAWLAAGGHPAHVDGLRHEHALLREHLEHFDDADHRRKFLRLLDAHDEKEEQIVYPDMVTRIDLRDGHLLQAVIGLAPPVAGADPVA